MTNMSTNSRDVVTQYSTTPSPTACHVFSTRSRETTSTSSTTVRSPVSQIQRNPLRKPTRSTFTDRAETDSPGRDQSAHLYDLESLRSDRLTDPVTHVILEEAHGETAEQLTSHVAGLTSRLQQPQQQQQADLSLPDTTLESLEINTNSLVEAARYNKGRADAQSDAALAAKQEFETDLLSLQRTFQERNLLEKKAYSLALFERELIVNVAKRLREKQTQDSRFVADELLEGYVRRPLGRFREKWTELLY